MHKNVKRMIQNSDREPRIKYTTATILVFFKIKFIVTI